MRWSAACLLIDDAFDSRQEHWRQTDDDNSSPFVVQRIEPGCEFVHSLCRGELLRRRVDPAAARPAASAWRAKLQPR